MASDHPVVRLGDYVDACLGKMLDAQKNRGELHPYLGNSNVRWGSFELEELATMRFEDHEEARYGIRDGDLIVCEGGEPGRCAIWRGNAPMKIQKALHRVRTKAGLDNYFLYYWFLRAGRAGELEPFFTGTTIKHLTGKALAELRIPLPPIDLQREAARVLRSLDEKIDLNRRISQTLEAMAQAIFKSWFVDFEPVKAKIAAKTEGRDPLRAAMSVISGKADAELNTLPPEAFEQLAATAALFPEEMQESELGEIPKGWLASKIGNVTSRVAMGPFGSDIKKENFVDEGVPVIRGGNLTDGLVERNYVFITESKADELKNANAFPDDIVITHRGTLGQVGLIPSGSKFPRYVVSQSQMLLSVDKERMSSRYLFEFLRSEIGRRLLLSNTSQVGVPAIARPTGSVKGIPLLVPQKTVLNAYDKLLAPLLGELLHTTKSSETLVELRDTLLPKLLSGELPVEAIAESAGAA